MPTITTRENRTHFVSVRLTRLQKARLELRAVERDVPVSDYVRGLIEDDESVLAEREKGS